MSYDGSAYPNHPSLEDARALRREEARRADSLADLPDEWTDEDYEAAESAYQGWVKWLNSPSPEQGAEAERYRKAWAL